MKNVFLLVTCNEKRNYSSMDFSNPICVSTNEETIGEALRKEIYAENMYKKSFEENIGKEIKKCSSLELFEYCINQRVEYFHILPYDLQD